MKLSLTHKFFLVLLSAVCAVVLGMFFLMQYAFDRGFLNYVNTVEAERFETLTQNLETSYAEEGNWQFLRSNYRLWGEFLDNSQPDDSRPMPRLNVPDNRRPGQPHRPPEKFRPGKADRPPPREAPEKPKLFEHRIVLLDKEKNILFGPSNHPDTMRITPLKQAFEVIGYLGLIPQQHLIDDLQLRFVKKQKKTFAIIALIMASLAALLALPLAKQMVKRLKSLAEATHQLAAGHYETRLEAGSADELGQLTDDFNTLARTLEHNEQLRRQWVGDISHELRTPLAVLRGEIEAMQDNVRPATPEALASLHAETMRLGRLVDDLFQLSMSDIGALTYQKEELNLSLLLNEAVDSFRPEFTTKNISITRNWTEENSFIIFGDPDRLHQLFDNLLNNSLKYTNSGGKLDLKLTLTDETVTLIFQDSTPGVEAPELSKLFDRLYRVEGSRNRSSGGAGLGLAICKNIVEAHGGKITAGPSESEGLLIKIRLPLQGGNR
jgi:two-component system sensor histidine kinase BaeS